MGSPNLDLALKVAEAHQEREMGSKISARMRKSMQENGMRDGPRSMILTSVAGEHYTKAIEEIEEFAKSNEAYPQFGIRAERYLTYSADLVHAIRAKRSFPGMQNLSMSKQQDLFDRAMSHFEDLKVTLKKIEQIAAEVKLDDVRSTVWVLKALMYCVFIVFVAGFVMEVSKGVLPSAVIVADDTFGTLTNSIFDKLGL
jgi:hypothetical protein